MSATRRGPLPADQVAALGAAFAAAGAGAANAAPAVPDATQALGSVSQGLPTENVTKAMPGAGEALAQSQPAVGTGLFAAQPAVERVLADGPSSSGAWSGLFLVCRAIRRHLNWLALWGGPRAGDLTSPSARGAPVT
ncbi:hypothetical protein M2163_000687 [Streptomyces sp. SAI-135]|uniref:ATP-binding protein n=1 Tax=unclassified Streptomyces TaxID=2593676 RepID=UPI00247347AE|nr:MULTISPECIES: ATP-binding protein [unclassified Streptomyces]MDH6522806.1 hypothetical protein [Streptomyces sp. SAI-090]MDH6554427.1 hypothetical protein [Streptomyces sp. SAI-041]MDH6613579.1 hypothetical protein [Streptomyces sp. SAI-135]